tara:strand:+ start:1468 stop:2130 length:663 start_codon:yes stop_codon:yes gene_type:complete
MKKEQKKKFKVTFLLDAQNSWIYKYIYNFKFNQKNKFIFKISKNYKKIKNQDIVFILNFTKILPEQFLKKNKLNLVIHQSNLPKDRGFAPVQNQILRNKNKIFASVIKASKKVDKGPICLKTYFNLNGTELYDEIRKKQGFSIIKIIKNILIKYPNLKFKKQTGKQNFNKKRNYKDSELNINQSIRKQFNHLRINCNEEFPSFFYFKKKKYILKIFMENK